MERISSLTDRVPPQNLEAEQSTLGSMMLDRAAIEKAAEILRPEDFYREAHQMIFDALWSLAERDEPVDLITLQEELRSRGKLEMVGGIDALMALVDSVPTSVNIEYYARIVEEKSILRRLIAAASEIAHLAHQEAEDVNSLTDRAEQIIFRISQRRLGEYFTPLWPLLTKGWDALNEKYKDQGITSGLPTGLRDLDAITAGLQPSDFIIVAARPSVGKTALALNIAVNTAIKTKQPVAMFSIEMSKEQLVIRMLCSQARVDSHRLRTGRLSQEDWNRLANATNVLAEAPIFIDDSTEITPMAMRAKCRRLKAERGLGLVVVDYLQLVHWHRTVENRVQEISEIARALKGLARELKVPVLTCAQLSRMPERREDKRPVLSDLRESGSIEAEADVVGLLYRQAYYDQKEVMDSKSMEEGGGGPGTGVEKVQETEIIIAKHRNGPTGTIKLGFLPRYACFQDLEIGRTE